MLVDGTSGWKYSMLRPMYTATRLPFGHASGGRSVIGLYVKGSVVMSAR
jgi:hypothetical protein